MWILLYILLSPNGVEDVRPVKIYYSKQKCHQKIQEVAERTPDNNIWLACIPIEGVKETLNDHQDQDS